MALSTKKSLLTLAVSAAVLGLTACGGGSGSGAGTGTGTDSGGDPQSLTIETSIAAGDSRCFQGGVQTQSGVDANSNDLLEADEIDTDTLVCTDTQLDNSKNFVRIATFNTCEQIDANCNADDETVAEIVAASSDGNTLIYTDSELEQLGFVDITDPASPKAAGVVALSGEPTSVSVKGAYALAGVNTSADYINTSGHLAVIDIATQSVVHSIDLGGQPDSVAVSPDGNYAAIAIENERDEDLGEGVPPQMPAGFLVIVDMSSDDMAQWTATTVDMVGMSDLYANDPEPEYVDINSDNLAVVTLQENNHIALVDLSSGEITHHFSAGSQSLEKIDTEEEEPALISLTDAQADVLREPDGVSWINNEYFATADEGDLDGGSRGFTVYNLEGEVVYNSQSDLDHLAVRFGHYPDARSGNKGNEPENAEVGIYDDQRFMFIASERANLVHVYNAAQAQSPVYKQSLPAGVGPEGVLAIGSRNLLIAASEKDDRGDKMRAGLNIYAYAEQDSTYPSIQSADRADQTPIPWSALSGLAVDTSDDNIVYSVEDSFYQRSRIFKIDTATLPALLSEEILITDASNVLKDLLVAQAGTYDTEALVNADTTVNLDLEGVATSSEGGFWLVSEGAGTIGDLDRPVTSPNLLIKVNEQGQLTDAQLLPTALNDKQLRFGFEGVTEYMGKVYVAHQRAWDGDDEPRISIFNTDDNSWSHIFYPLDAASSQNGGWVGLSDIVSLGDDEFAVLERDNQGGPDASIKRIYKIDLSALSEGETATKTLVRDLINEGDLAAAGGNIAEKVEGLAVDSQGNAWVVNDNDGVDDNSGETQLLKIDSLF